jgi:hypothetical protein
LQSAGRFRRQRGNVWDGRTGWQQTQTAVGPRRSARMTHFCSDRVTHRRRGAFVRKLKVGKAISSPPKAGCWVRFREQSRVISRECRSVGTLNGAEASPAVLVASLPMQRTGPPLRNTCIRHAGASAAEVHNPRWQRCCAPSSFGPWIANAAMLTQLGNATFIEVGVNRLPGW